MAKEKRKNEFQAIDAFLKWYKSVRPETIYVVKNPKRFDDVAFAIRTIAELAESSNPGRVRFRRQ